MASIITIIKQKKMIMMILLLLSRISIIIFYMFVFSSLSLSLFSSINFNFMIVNVNADVWYDTFGPLDKSHDPFLVRSWKFDIGQGMRKENGKNRRGIISNLLLSSSDLFSNSYSHAHSHSHSNNNDLDYELAIHRSHSKYKICRLYDADNPDIERVFIRERKNDKDFYERFLLPSKGNIVSLLKKQGKIEIDSFIDDRGKECYLVKPKKKNPYYQIGNIIDLGNIIYKTKKLNEKVLNELHCLLRYNYNSKMIKRMSLIHDLELGIQDYKHFQKENNFLNKIQKKIKSLLLPSNYRKRRKLLSNPSNYNDCFLEDLREPLMD